MAPLLGAGSGPSSSDKEDKKIWFDYIKTLNERRLQSAQRSGFSSYLLLVALAGIAYRFVPRLPSFMKTPGGVKEAAAFFLLETDFLYFALLVLATLTAYCAEGTENRIIPEHRRRVAQIFIAVAIVFVATLAVGHILVVWRFSPSNLWVRRGLTLFGFYWILNIFVVVWKEVSKIRKSLANKIPIPRFTALQFEPTLLFSSVSTAIFGLLGGISGASLILYSRSLSPDWTQPWKAASVTLGFFVLSLYILNRWGLSIGEDNYLGLERDIILQDLSVDEIRTRFVEQLIGQDASQWLDGLLAELKASNESLEKFHGTARRQLQEIQGINPTYSAERLSRATKLVDELQKQTAKHKLQFGQFRFRLELFFDTYLGPKERQALSLWKREFSKTADDCLRIIEDGGKLVSEIRATVNNLNVTH